MKKILLISLIIFFNTKIYADDKINLGREVFNNKDMCGSCHILQAAGSEGDIGPNLDMLKPQLPQIIYAVKNGIGVMPSWEGILTKGEIEAVAYYVFNSTSK